MFKHLKIDEKPSFKKTNYLIEHPTQILKNYRK